MNERERDVRRDLIAAYIVKERLTIAEVSRQSGIIHQTLRRWLSEPTVTLSEANVIAVERWLHGKGLLAVKREVTTVGRDLLRRFGGGK